MGAWGVRAFDNDTAGDWADHELASATNLRVVSQRLASIEALGDDEYLNAETASIALAACEVLARLRGNPGQQYPAVDAWVTAHPLTPPPQLLKLADRVIDRILGERSELQQLWNANEEWSDAVEELRSRVTG